MLLSFVLMRALLRRTTAVCLKPPDIESRFELALGRVVVAIATVLGGERRCRYVLLVIDAFLTRAGFASSKFSQICHFEARCATVIISTLC